MARTSGAETCRWALRTGVMCEGFVWILTHVHPRGGLHTSGGPGDVLRVSLISSSTLVLAEVHGENGQGGRNGWTPWTSLHRSLSG